MATPRKLPSGSWFVQVRLGGKSYSHTADTRLACEKWQADLRSTAVLDGSAQVKHTLSELRQGYLLSDSFLSKKASTQAVEFRNSQSVVDHFPVRYVEDIDRQSVILFKKSRLETVSKKTGKTLSNTKVRLEMACLSSMLSHAVAEEWISLNLALHVSRPFSVTDRRTARVSDGDALALFSAAEKLGPQVYWFYFLLFFLGCRPGELVTLTRSSVNLSTSEIFLPTSKNGEPRVLLIPSAIFAAFSVYVQSLDPELPKLFNSRDKVGQYKPFDYYNYWRRLRSSVSFSVPYVLRHERVSRWIESGMSDSVVKVLAGHLSIITTQAYNHLRARSALAPVNAVAQADVDRLAKGLGSLAPSDLESGLRLLVRIKQEAVAPVPRVVVDGQVLISVPQRQQ